MLESHALALGLSFFCIALVYATVGQTGSSSYVAIMALLSVAPEQMKSAALILNIIVSSIATVQFIRRGVFCRRAIGWLSLGSIPFAFWGGRTTLPDGWYLFLTGIFLIAASLRAFYSAKDVHQALLLPPSSNRLILLGALLGYLSGLTGVGGGIFLSPIFNFFRWADVRTISGITSAFVLINASAAFIGLLSIAPPERFDIQSWLIGAALGGFMGAELGARHLKLKTLQYIRGTTLMFAGIKLISIVL